MSISSEQKTDLQRLLEILPQDIQAKIEADGRQADLLEVVIDLGRRPTARYVDGEVVLRQTEASAEEIAQVLQGIGDFDDDNRAGITRTLHRISGIRNRRGDVVGLTCRVGRAVHGTIDIIADIIEEGHSVLLLGRPGVGKTTMLREMARILAEKRRVIIVDTSNEIGGDGDIPHPAVGQARRMQVPRPSRQHETMIEAVENHNPEIIVIDEIGREQEAAAARTINERGVQLIGTAHGNTLENLLLNPTLSDLVGGIESVTLSDEEARRRGTQKTVLERRAPPTFDVLIEIQDRAQLLVHPNVTSSVDAMLRGEPLYVQMRTRDENDQVLIEEQNVVVSSTAVTGRREMRERDGRERSSSDSRARRDPDGNGRLFSNGKPTEKEKAGNESFSEVEFSIPNTAVAGSLNIYAYGVARNRLLQAARRLRARINLVDTLSEADVLVTLKSYYRKRSKLIYDAERRRTPVYVLRANTVSQMEGFLVQALKLDEPETADPFEAGIADVEQGLQMIHTGLASVDLNPASRAIRAYQHQMVRQANLVSHSYGKDPNRYVRIFNTPRPEN